MKKSVTVAIIVLMFSSLAPITVTADAPLPPDPPVGPTDGIIGGEYTYTITVQINYKTIFYRFNFGDGGVSDWIAPLPNEDTVSCGHSWDAAGTYFMKSQATFDPASEDFSESEKITILTVYPNDVPSPPKPLQGKKWVEINEIATYSVTNNDTKEVYFQMYWGDEGNVSDWSGPYQYNETVNYSYQWDMKGTYLLKARASYYPSGFPYSESENYSVHVVEKLTPTIEIAKVSYFYVDVKLKNNCPLDVRDINWSINVTPLPHAILPYTVDKTGNFSLIRPNGYIMISSGIVLGFGECEIVVTVQMQEKRAEKTVKAIVFLFVILLDY